MKYFMKAFPIPSTMSYEYHIYIKSSRISNLFIKCKLCLSGKKNKEKITLNNNIIFIVIHQIIFHKKYV